MGEPFGLAPDLSCQSVYAPDETKDRGPTSICTAHRRDARLIAAAPELLEALKDLFEHAGQAVHWVPHILLIGAIKKANDAIAKAEEK